VKYFLQNAHTRGLSRVRIIHGKGRSAKKREVRAILENNPLVESFTDDGYNWGSTVVFLAQKKVSE
jgi:DNA-nicking Smr family endonuclease